MVNSLKMARWRNSTEFEISWHGEGANDVADEIFDLVLEKVRLYARGAPVRAKVILVERTDTDNGSDTLGIVEVNGTHYFLLITNGFLLVMDLHYARNEAVCRLLESTIHLP